MRIQSWHRWTCAVTYAALIFVASSLPAASLPHPGLWRFDKLLHFGAFFGLGVLVMWAWRRYFASVAMGTLYGVLDELHQRLTPGRDASAFDALADLAGCAVGACACWLWLRSRRARRSNAG